MFRRGRAEFTQAQESTFLLNVHSVKAVPFIKSMECMEWKVRQVPVKRAKLTLVVTGAKGKGAKGQVVVPGQRGLRTWRILFLPLLASVFLESRDSKSRFALESPGISRHTHAHSQTVPLPQVSSVVQFLFLPHRATSSVAESSPLFLFLLPLLLHVNVCHPTGTSFDLFG